MASEAFLEETTLGLVLFGFFVVVAILKYLDGFTYMYIYPPLDRKFLMIMIFI